jgi:hypothetical protein
MIKTRADSLFKMLVSIGASATYALEPDARDGPTEIVSVRSRGVSIVYTFTNNKLTKEHVIK